ncbi:MAG: type II toxin-antitoxin system RelB/DinJ family antitoxin [Anaerovibrio sp.]|uniref:type II toxin-antitoxin system RelB/DinJ family antitoxin n=1 Tax=Anaerovibrio sp. TaxID=1872532 RepID=UPI0025C22A4D|nr:type II toxin-antitoxin system RelB/DinJ family antitoxin [Anaerovibrio sp.]MBE6100390.1 type II toxin-antitoxin system RelB/DinJ family antitoxin [Anaerovibrio sp.]
MASTTIQVRMDSELKQQVEAKLKSMGLNMSTAVNMLAHQIVKQNRIPFEIIADDNTPMLDRLPKTVNADQMTDEELHLHLLEGFHEAVNGKSRPAAQVFAEMRAKYNI